MINNNSQLIVITNLKGGASKTTTTETVAVGIKTKNPARKTVIVDFDLRNQSNKFIEKRKEHTNLSEIESVNFHFQDAYKNTEEDIVEFIKDLKESFEVIIIDTSANDSKDFRILVQLADIVIVPTSDSDNDLDQTHETLALIKSIVLDNPAFKAFDHTVKVLINNVNAHKFNSKYGIIKNVKSYLKDFDSSFFMNSVVSSRAAYKKMLSTGKIASEINVKAKPEIDSLITEIEELITLKQQLNKKVA